MSASPDSLSNSFDSSACHSNNCSPSPPKTFATALPAHISSYPSRSISNLAPGPIRTSFNGTVVNIFGGYPIQSQAPKSAKGCLKLLVKDKTGEILVKLWYADVAYELFLGSEITVHTTHISAMISPSMSAETIAQLPASIVTSIFPERDVGCMVEIHHKVGLVTGLHSFGTRNPPLIDLKTFMHSPATSMAEGLLMCCVLEVGQPLEIRTKDGSSFQTVCVNVIDASIQVPVSLSLSSSLFASAERFLLKETVLIISYPRLLSQRHRRIKLSPKSQVLLMPATCITDTDLQLEGTAIFQAARLRRYANNLYPPCNSEEAELSTYFVEMNQLERKQFTLAMFLDCIALEPEERHIGYISTIITDLNLVSLLQENQLYCMPCPGCRNNIFSNMTEAFCSNMDCEYESSLTPINLRPNPQILSGFSDETGGLEVRESPTNHNLSVSDQAWRALLGLGRINDLESMSEDKLREIEDVVRFVRVTLVMGWSGSAKGKIVLLNMLP